MDMKSLAMEVTDLLELRRRHYSEGRKIVRAIFKAISNGLKKGQRVTIQNFGTFIPQKKRPVYGTNLIFGYSGQPLIIGVKGLPRRNHNSSVRFIPAKGIKCTPQDLSKPTQSTDSAQPVADAAAAAIVGTRSGIKQPQSPPTRT